MYRVIERLALLCMTLMLMLILIIPVGATGTGSLSAVTTQLKEAAAAIERIGAPPGSNAGRSISRWPGRMQTRSTPSQWVGDTTSDGFDLTEFQDNITAFFESHLTTENLKSVWLFMESDPGWRSPPRK